MRAWFAGFILLIHAIFSQVTANGAEHMIDSGKLRSLENQLEELQRKYNIPGMSGAVAEGKDIVWLKAFGKADQEHDIPVSTNTVFHLASLTKPYAVTIFLQLAETGKLDLDTPVAKFGIKVQNSHLVTVRHVLSHTSEGVPGEAYKYSGQRFHQLDKVIEKLTTPGKLRTSTLRAGDRRFVRRSGVKAEGRARERSRLWTCNFLRQKIVFC